jgi:hypothetical protein
MKATSLFLAAATFMTALPASASALFLLKADLDAAQEVPAPIGVPVGAGGIAMMTYDEANNLLKWNITFQNLSGPAILAHFHSGPPGVAGPVRIDIGTVSGLNSPMIGQAFLTAPQENGLLSGNWYINIHTQTNPRGEIRGQVTVEGIPEPATLALLGAGMLGLAAIRRRR